MNYVPTRGVSHGVAVCVPRCRRMCPAVSPYVSGGVAVCVPRCRRMCPAMSPYASGGVAVCVPRVRLTPLRRAPARDFCYARNALCARALHAALPFAVFRAAVCRLSCRKRHPFARPKAAFRAPAIFDTHAALPSTIIKGAPSESPACRRTHAGAPRYIIPIDKTLLSIHTDYSTSMRWITSQLALTLSIKSCFVLRVSGSVGLPGVLASSLIPTLYKWLRITL